MPLRPVAVLNVKVGNKKRQLAYLNRTEKGRGWRTAAKEVVGRNKRRFESIDLPKSGVAIDKTLD